MGEQVWEEAPSTQIFRHQKQWFSHFQYTNDFQICARACPYSRPPEGGGKYMEAHAWEAYYQFIREVVCITSFFILLVRTSTWPTLAAWKARKYGRVIWLEEKFHFDGYLEVSATTDGEGSGTPLQYSCLGNPMGRGAW